jgi:hypothetical protein
MPLCGESGEGCKYKPREAAWPRRWHWPQEGLSGCTT